MQGNSGSETRRCPNGLVFMKDELVTIGTRYIASVGRHEAIVELRRDGWYRGIFNDDTRHWEVQPSHVGSAQEGRDYCESHLEGLKERALKLDWKQVGGFRRGQHRDEAAKPGNKTA